MMRFASSYSLLIVVYFYRKNNRRLPLDFEVAHLSREKVAKCKLYVPDYIVVVSFVVYSLLVPIFGAVCRLGQIVWIIWRRASISLFNTAI